MSNTYDELVDYAEGLVNIINEKYNTGATIAYLILLTGDGNYKVESYPGAGHNYQAVVDAIHNCYKNNPNNNVEKGYYDGIMTLIRVTKNIRNLQLLLNVLSYELQKERDGKAYFQLSMTDIWNKTCVMIEENLATFRNSDTDVSRRLGNSFDEWLERYLDVFKEFGLVMKR